MSMRFIKITVGTTLLLAFGMGGCPPAAPPPPPAEAILFGTWVLTATESLDLNNKIFVFDNNGRIFEIRTTVVDTTLVERDVHKNTLVTGTGVRIVTKSDLIFEGQLNDARTVITGRLRTEFNFPFTSNTLITDKGPGTFTKQ